MERLSITLLQSTSFWQRWQPQGKACSRHCASGKRCVAPDGTQENTRAQQRRHLLAILFFCPSTVLSRFSSVSVNLSSQCLGARRKRQSGQHYDAAACTLEERSACGRDKKQRSRRPLSTIRHPLPCFYQIQTLLSSLLSPASHACLPGSPVRSLFLSILHLKSLCDFCSMIMRYADVETTGRQQATSEAPSATWTVLQTFPFPIPRCGVSPRAHCFSRTWPCACSLG